MPEAYPGGRYWKYFEDGIICLGCRNQDTGGQMNPFDRFDRMEHASDCPVKDLRGGMKKWR